MIDKITSFIPEKYFVKSLKDNTIGQIKIAIVREVTNPLIIRSTDPEATITLRMSNDTEVVEIPPRKLKSKEKLLGLQLCREFKAVDDSVRYNIIDGKEKLNNVNSALFGDTSTKSGDTAGLASRVIYDWAYSIRDVTDITDKLQHNALGENGTMWNEAEGKQRQSLFLTEYVLPETYFPHFVTIDNASPELFLHLLFCILNQHRYGAQTTTNASNMNNHIVAIGFDDFEKPINSYTISKAWHAKYQGKDPEEPTFDSISSFVQDKMKGIYGEKNLVKELQDFLTLVLNLWREEDRSTLQSVYSSAIKQVDEYMKEIKMVKK